MSTLVAHGGWFLNNPLAPPTNNIEGPLHTGTLGQQKLGGLILNNQKTASWGLDVFGTSTQTGCQLGASEGCVGIGTNNPHERLDIVGNFNIDGLIKPNDNAGAFGQALTMTSGISMDWQDEFAWMNISRVDVTQPNGTCVSFFPQCPSGWSEYDDKVFVAACTAPPPSGHVWGWSYGNEIRICNKPK